MARIFAQNVTEIAIKGKYAGRPVVNVLHYVNDEAAVNDADKARDILNNWQDHVMDGVTQQYVLDGADWRSLDPDDTNQGTLTPDTVKATQGAGAGPGTSPNVAFLVRKITNSRQRGQRNGRMYLAGVAESAITEAGNLAAAHQTAFQGYLDSFLAGVNDDVFGPGGGSGLVVLNTTPESRIAGTQPVTLTYRTVSALVLDSKAATQRERMR